MNEKRNNEVELSDRDDSGLFFQLFMTHQKSFYAFILASVHNYTDANDILQDAATVMWQKFGEFDKNTNFVAWGITISRNLILKYYTQRKRSRVQFNDDLFNEISDRMEKSIGNMDPRIEALKKCTKKLSDAGRTMIDMRYNKGMTVKAIANQLNRPVQGMYKAMARLQDALQKCIEKQLPEKGV